MLPSDESKLTAWVNFILIKWKMNDSPLTIAKEANQSGLTGMTKADACSVIRQYIKNTTENSTLGTKRRARP